MELGIVMLSVPMTSNSSTVKPTARTGNRRRKTKTLVLESTVLAAVRWMFGKPTLWPLLTLLTLARLEDNKDVREKNVVTMTKVNDTMVSVTKMAVISILGGWGTKAFFGPGARFIDTKKPVQVITQWITSDNTDSGDLVEIRRFYVQNGVKYSNTLTNIPGVKATNSVSNDFCTATKTAFGDKNDFSAKGGLKVMGEAASRGMVLVMSLWDDHDVNMLWLDSNYPTNQPPSKAGISRGPCSIDSGKPEDVEAHSPDATAIFSDIKFGEIGSTF